MIGLCIMSLLNNLLEWWEEFTQKEILAAMASLVDSNITMEVIMIGSAGLIIIAGLGYISISKFFRRINSREKATVSDQESQNYRKRFEELTRQKEQSEKELQQQWERETRDLQFQHKKECEELQKNLQMRHEQDRIQERKQLEAQHKRNQNELEYKLQLCEQERDHFKGHCVTQGKQIEEIGEERKKLSLRLAEEMNHKVAADESNVENVSIKNRPLNIADDYDALITNDWLNAKEELDEMFPDTAEEVKIKLLYNVLLFAEEKMEAFYKFYWKQQAAIFRKPTAIFTSPVHPQNVEVLMSNVDIRKLGVPKVILNSVGDLLRSTDEILDFDKFVQDIKEELKNEWEVEEEEQPEEDAGEMDTAETSKSTEEPTEKILDPEEQARQKMREHIGSSEEIGAYAKACLNFCWKMVLQRPQMCFKEEPKYDEALHDIHWGSVSVHSDFDLVHVYPVLKHGTNFMKKGKVFLVGKTEIVDAGEPMDSEVATDE